MRSKKVLQKSLLLCRNCVVPLCIPLMFGRKALICMAAFLSAEGACKNDGHFFSAFSHSLIAKNTPLSFIFTKLTLIDFPFCLEESTFHYPVSIV